MDSPFTVDSLVGGGSGPANEVAGVRVDLDGRSLRVDLGKAGIDGREEASEVLGIAIEEVAAPGHGHGILAPRPSKLVADEPSLDPVPTSGQHHLGPEFEQVSFLGRHRPRRGAREPKLRRVDRRGLSIASPTIGGGSSRGIGWSPLGHGGGIIARGNGLGNLVARASPLPIGTSDGSKHASTSTNPGFGLQSPRKIALS